MTESEFFTLIDATLQSIELALDTISQTTDVDIECSRAGNLLDIEFMHNRSKIIINSQAPLQEIWVAARSGGFHYKYVDAQWINTRDGSELFDSLSLMLSEQAGQQIIVTP